MTRSEVMKRLQAKGMGPDAEAELKQLLQLHEKAAKVNTRRKERQNAYRWQAIGNQVMGLGLYWYNQYVRESR